MSLDSAPLFTPYTLGGVELANRFVMAPMTRQFSPGGVPGADVAAYYARRAPHVGLIVTEGTYVDHPSAGASDRVPRFYGAEALAGWRAVAQAVHAVGGRIVPQLWHLGATRTPGSPPHPDAPVLSPSGRRADGTVVGDPATVADLDAVVASFARAARDAQLAGFDGVEIHGAHGYLLDQFRWTKKLTGRPVVAIGSVGVAQAFRGENEERASTLSVAPLLELFEQGEFDLIALGRALLSDPAWPTKLRDGRLDAIHPYDKADETRLT